MSKKKKILIKTLTSAASNFCQVWFKTAWLSLEIFMLLNVMVLWWKYRPQRHLSNTCAWSEPGGHSPIFLEQEEGENSGNPASHHCTRMFWSWDLMRSSRTREDNQPMGIILRHLANHKSKVNIRFNNSKKRVKIVDYQRAIVVELVAARIIATIGTIISVGVQL